MQQKPWKSMPSLLVAILLVGALVLSACGSDNNATPTVVATPVVESTATPLVENTPTAEVGTTETVTDTGGLAPSETITSSEGLTATEEINPSETTTDTTGASATETMTTTGEITGTETTTGTESVTPMETITATEEISPSATMTETGSSVSSSSATTDTGTISGTTGSSGTMSGTMGISGAEGMLIRSSTLSGYDFVNEDGQVSGNIADYLVDVSTGNILFAFVEYGGLLDIGDKNLVMPLSAFRMGDGQLILNFNEQELQNFPDVGDNWPDVSTPDWDTDVSNFWRNLGINPGVAVTTNSITDTGSVTGTGGSNVMWLNDMTGYSLADLGSGAGTIQDTLIDLSRSRIKYILFDFGTGTNESPYIIPYSALDVQNIGNNQIAFNSNIDATVLQTAPRYDVNLYPNDQVLTQDFSTEIDQFWAEHGISDSANQ